MQQREVRHVAVIGTGTIGASGAAFFLSRGLRVTASDPAPQAEAEGRDIAALAADRDRFLVDLLALKGPRRDS